MALIVDKKMFGKGMVLILSFSAVLAVIFAPVFPGIKGEAVNGLDYADNMFNQLSKGSSYFIPTVAEQVKTLEGKTINVTVKVKNADKAVQIFSKAAGDAVQAQARDGSLTVSGNLAKLLTQVLADSDAMYKNDAAKVKAFYGMEGKEVMETWWHSLQPMIKELQKAKMIQEAKVIDTVMKKGIEPAYNFFGIQPEKITDKILLSAGLLIFYVVYTMWYGFAIFDLFGGIGLTMKKAKVRKEA